MANDRREHPRLLTALSSSAPFRGKRFKSGAPYPEPSVPLRPRRPVCQPCALSPFAPLEMIPVDSLFRSSRFRTTRRRGPQLIVVTAIVAVVAAVAGVLLFVVPAVSNFISPSTSSVPAGQGEVLVSYPRGKCLAM